MLIRLPSSSSLSHNMNGRFSLSKRIHKTTALNFLTSVSPVMCAYELNTSYKLNSSWKIKAGFQYESDYLSFIAGFKKDNFELSIPLSTVECSISNILLSLGIIAGIAGLAFWKNK